MDFSFFLFLCIVAVWLYYPSQWLLEGLGYIKFLERQRIYWEFIRLINCLTLLVSLFSFYPYIYEGWHVFAGWNLVTETDFVKEAVQVNRGVIGILVVLVIPFMNLILSMMVLFHSYKKIKNPKENIFTRDDY